KGPAAMPTYSPGHGRTCPKPDASCVTTGDSTMGFRLFATVALYLSGALGPAQAAQWCVSTSAGLSQALLAASINGEPDIIRLQAGTYVASQPDGFRANLAGGALEISGGWSPSCLFRRRGVRS